MEHVDYPHEAGTLYDCYACESECYCQDGFTCIHCSTLWVDLDDEGTVWSDYGGWVA